MAGDGPADVDVLQATEPGVPPSSRTPALTLTTLIVLCGTVSSAIFHYVMAAYLHHRYPYSTFLFNPSDRFMDFFNVYRHAQEFRPGVSGNMVYSPLLHAVMTMATLLPAWVAFAMLVIAFMVAIVTVLWQWTTVGLAADPLLRSLHVAVLALLSYPVLFALDRGNLEMLVFTMLAAFFWLHYVRRSPWAWLPLGLAIAAKYYWVTLLVLLLLDRQWRQATWCMVTAVASTVVSALAISVVSGYSVSHVFGNLYSTLGGHVDSTGSLAIASYSHSMWSWVICATRWSDFAFHWLPSHTLYLLAAAVVFLVVLRRLMRRDLDDWQKATALVVCTLLLPFESKDYTSIQLLLPFTMFAALPLAGRRAWIIAVLFALPLIPLDYWYLTFFFWHSWVSVASLIYPVVLVALLVVSLRRLPDGVMRDTSGEAVHANRPPWIGAS